MEAALLRLCVSLTWLIFIPGTQWAEAFTVDDEVKLKNVLLKTSAITTVRPERVTRVQLSFNLVAINDVDIKNEQFSVSGWWFMRWADPRLSWTSRANYSNIKVVQVYSSDIWTPALVVDNSVKDLSAINEATIPLRIRQDGNVTWNPPGILVTSCDMDVKYFPFDTQTCTIQVTSFGYTINEVDITVHSGLNQAYYQENGEWKLLETWNGRYEYTDDDFKYAKVEFSLKIQRRAAYYGLNMILPVLLNSLLIPLVFLLPHHSGEKIGYCLTVLLAYVVILTIVADGLPTTAKNQSLLGVYIVMVLCLSALSVFLAIHSLYLFHISPDTPVPTWLAKLTRRSLRIMRCQCTKKRAERSISPGENEPMKRKQHQPNHPSTRVSIVSYTKRQSAISSSAINAELSEGDTEYTSWHTVAKAYDAFFLRVYFSIILVCSVVFLGVLGSRK